MARAGGRAIPYPPPVDTNVVTSAVTSRYTQIFAGLRPAYPTYPLTMGAASGVAIPYPPPDDGIDSTPPRSIPKSCVCVWMIVARKADHTEEVLCVLPLVRRGHHTPGAGHPRLAPFSAWRHRRDKAGRSPTSQPRYQSPAPTSTSTHRACWAPTCARPVLMDKMGRRPMSRQRTVQLLRRA